MSFEVQAPPFDPLEPWLGDLDLDCNDLVNVGDIIHGSGCSADFKIENQFVDGNINFDVYSSNYGAVVRPLMIEARESATSEYLVRLDEGTGSLNGGLVLPDVVYWRGLANNNRTFFTSGLLDTQDFRMNANGNTVFYRTDTSANGGFTYVFGTGQTELSIKSPTGLSRIYAEGGGAENLQFGEDHKLIFKSSRDYVNAETSILFDVDINNVGSGQPIYTGVTYGVDYNYTGAPSNAFSSRTGFASVVNYVASLSTFHNGAQRASSNVAYAMGPSGSSMSAMEGLYVQSATFGNPAPTVTSLVGATMFSGCILGGQVTNNVGLAVGGGTTFLGGSMQTNVALKVTGTTTGVVSNWALQVTNANVPSYFQGKVSVGHTNTPNYAIDSQNIRIRDTSILALGGTTDLDRKITLWNNNIAGSLLYIGHDGVTSSTENLFLMELGSVAGDPINFSSTTATNVNYTGLTLAADILHAGDGSVSAPSISFADDDDCGFYRIGSNNFAATVGGVKAMEYRLATSGLYGNLGFGSVASLSDSFPILIERNQNAATIMGMTNANGGSQATVGLRMTGDTGAISLGEMIVGPSASVVDAYSNRLYIRAGDALDGLSLIASEVAGNIKAYVAGVGATDVVTAWEKDYFKLNKGKKIVRTVQTGAATIANDEYFQECDSGSAFDLTLPTSPEDGQMHILKNIGSGIVTIKGDVDGSTDPTLAQYESIAIYYNSTDSEWYTWEF